MKLLFLNIITLLFFGTVTGQQKFTLQQCIEYALNNNLSIKENQLQENLAIVEYKQNRLSKFPSANFSNNDGYRLGKSQNPSTGILENKNFFSMGLNLTSSVEIFNWYSKNNLILASKWETEAAKAATDKIKNDLKLSTIKAYLQLLLASEQEKITLVQIQQSLTQLTVIRKKVSAGVLPELNALELEAQLARDSINFHEANGNVEQAKYTLKGFMNMDPAQPLEIQELDAENVGSIMDLQPDAVYATAQHNFPLLQIDEFKLNAVKANMQTAKGAMYPTFSAYASLSTSYGYSRTPIFRQVFSGYQPSGWVISNGSGGYVDVQRPVYVNGDKDGYFFSDPLGTQFNSNFGQVIGINISVPIFNGWSAKGNYEKSKLRIKEIELQKEQDNQVLKREIYEAYSAAATAMEKLASSKRAVDIAQKVLILQVNDILLGR